MLSGIFATWVLRNCSGPSPSGAHPGPPRPGLRGRPSEAADGPPRASRAFAGRAAPPRARRRLRGRLRAWEGPRRGGGLRVSLRSLPGRLPGLRCSSRRALRRSRFRCPLGFPFSLSPSLYLHSINRHPPCQAPGVCPSPHFRAPYGTVGYRAVEHRGPRFTYAGVTYANGAYGDVRVGYHRVSYGQVPYAYAPVTYTRVSYHGVTYDTVTLLKRNLLLRSSNLRLRR